MESGSNKVMPAGDGYAALINVQDDAHPGDSNGGVVETNGEVKSECQPLLSCCRVDDNDAQLEDMYKGHETRAADALKRQRMKRIESLIDSEHSCCATLELTYYWLILELPLYVEIIVFLFLAYYIDVCLDVKTILIFLQGEDYKYASLNIFAIASANFYTFLDMMRAVPEGDRGDPRWQILAVGYLTPLFGHMLVLCWMSLRAGRKHKLLSSGKLAEAALEAFISSLVQTYALIYTVWDHDDKWFTVSLSVCSSFLSIGYCVTCFDSRDIGVDQVPGKLKSIGPRTALILLIRVAEVSSRITSLALFSVCTRQHIDTSFAEDYPQPFKLAVENFLLTGGPALVTLDWLVLLVMTKCSGRNLLHTLPSILCYINPLLELGNPITMRAPLYYGWRVIQLLGMVGYIYWGKLNNVDRIREILTDHEDMVMFSGTMTLLWMTLIPLIRWCLAAHAPIQWYEPDTYGAKPFELGQEHLVDDLLCSEEYSLRDAMQRQAHDTLDRGIELLTLSLEAIGNKSNNFEVFIQEPKNLGIQHYPMKNEIRIDKIEDEGDIKTWNDNNPPQHAVKIGDLITGINGKGGDAGELLERMNAYKKIEGKCSLSLHIKQTRTEEAAPAADAEGKATRAEDRRKKAENHCCSKLYLWGERVVTAHSKEQSIQRSADEIFSRALMMGANIMLRKNFKITPDMHLKLLQGLNRAMGVGGSVQERASTHMDRFLRILPKNKVTREYETDDLQLHQEKMLIIEVLGKRGWQSHSFRFFRRVNQLVREVAPEFEVANQPYPKPQFTNAKAWHDFAMRQMRALVSLWRSMPPMNSAEKERHVKDLKDLFRVDTEWKAMVQGAKISISKEKPLWNDEDLLDFCVAFSEAKDLGLLCSTAGGQGGTGASTTAVPAAVETAKEAGNVLQTVKSAIENMISDHQQKFKASLHKEQAAGNGGKHPRWQSFEEMQKDLRWIIDNEKLYKWHSGLTERCNEEIANCWQILEYEEEEERRKAEEEDKKKMKELQSAQANVSELQAALKKKGDDLQAARENEWRLQRELASQKQDCAKAQSLAETLRAEKAKLHEECEDLKLEKMRRQNSSQSRGSKQR